MGKVCTKHILKLLWKMVENMFFLDSEDLRSLLICINLHEFFKYFWNFPLYLLKILICDFL